MGVFSTIKNLFTGKQARATDSYNPFVPDWFYAGSDGTKVPVNQSTALNYSAVYACCNVKSKDVAMLPWDVYMRQGNLRKLAFWHDQYFLIKNEPNSDMTSFDFRRTILFDKYWWGDGAVWLERNKSGRPIAHHIIRPWQWEAHKDGKDRWFTVDGIGTVDPYDFIQISNQRGPNELRGNSVVSMARETIRVGLGSDKLASRIYSKGTHAKYVSEMDGVFTSQDEKEKFRNELNRINGGPEGSDIITLYNGAKLKELSMKMVDQQFLESRMFNLEEICRWFDVPPPRVHHDRNNKYNTSEQKSIDYVTYSILPDCIQLQQEFDRKIFRQGERGAYYTKINTMALVQGDSQAQAELFKTWIMFGIKTPDEVRALMDDNPLPDGLGAEPYMQSSMLPMRILDQAKSDPNALQKLFKQIENGSSNGHAKHNGSAALFADS